MLFHPLSGLIAALRGDEAAALGRIDLTVAHAKRFGHCHHAQYDVACIYALIGRADDAMVWLRDAAYNGFPCYGFFERDRLLARIRDMPAFGAPVRELREEVCEPCVRAYREVRER